jgi:hypothetical protein
MLEGPVDCDRPGAVELCAQWEALHDGSPHVWPREVCKVSPDRFRVVADAQSTHSHHTAKAKFSARLESFDAHSIDGRSARARLQSCTCRPALA